MRICLVWVNQRAYTRPARVRGVASGLLAFHSKLALYSEHGRVELVVNARPEDRNLPKTTHMLHSRCFNWETGKLMDRTLNALFRVQLNVAPGPVSTQQLVPRGLRHTPYPRLPSRWAKLVSKMYHIRITDWKLMPGNCKRTTRIKLLPSSG